MSSVLKLQDDPRTLVPPCLKRMTGDPAPNGNGCSDRQCDVAAKPTTSCPQCPGTAGSDIDGDLVAARGARGGHCEPDLMDASRHLVALRLKRPDVAHRGSVDEDRVPAKEVLDQGTPGDGNGPLAHCWRRHLKMMTSGALGRWIRSRWQFASGQERIARPIVAGSALELVRDSRGTQE